MTLGRQIAVKALAHLKATRAANAGKLPLEPWLDALGEAIDAGIAEHMPQITGEPILKKLSASQRKELFDSLVAACRYNPDEITRAKGAEITTAIRDIRLASPTLHASEIERRSEVFHRKYPTWVLTPTALAKWWCDLSPPKAERSIYDSPPDGWQDTLKEIAPEYIGQSWESVRGVYGRRILNALP